MSTSLSAYSAIVVDDEPLPRAHFVHLLREAGLGRVIEAASATECLQLIDIEPNPPNWAFLDVQMPGMDGLALADALGSGQTNIRTPSVVFVTGYDDYAIQAFERAAVDYLLKPVSRIRLATTLARLSARTDAVAKSLTVRDQPLTAAPIERLPIRIDYTVRLVSTDEIHAASAHGKRVHVVTADATYPTYYSLNQLEQRLPADKFLRVHDSWIVNLAEVLEIHSLGGQNYSIRLRSFDRLIPVSRRRYANLQHRLGLRG